MERDKRVERKGGSCKREKGNGGEEKQRGKERERNGKNLKNRKNLCPLDPQLWHPGAATVTQKFVFIRAAID